MSDLDEVSVRIGGIESTLTSHAEAHGRILTKLEDIQKSTSQMPAMHSRLDRIEKHTDQNTTFRQRAMAYILGLPVLGFIINWLADV